MKQWEADGSVPGLGILTLPSGVRTWYVRYRERNGQQRTQKIGRAEIINRAAARREALKILADVAQGQGPLTAKQQAAQGATMADLGTMMAKRHYATLRPKSASNYEMIWRLHILPAMGTKRIAQVERAAVFDLLDTLKGPQRNRVLQCLKAAFNKAELWGLRPDGTNPCAKIPRLKEKIRKRYLSDAELTQLMAALDTFGTTPVRWRFVQLVRLLMLTGARVGEICRGRRDWVDEAAGLLVIPAESHKTGDSTGEERVIHLPPAAITILRELRQRSNSEWIIAGDGDKYLVGYQKLWYALMEKAAIKNLKVHDLRHNFASVALTKAGLTLPQVGSLLGHASPVTTARYAHLIDEGARRMAISVAEQFS